MDDWKSNWESRHPAPHETPPWTCPRCRLLNRETATYCDCGYNRTTGETIDVWTIEEAKVTRVEGIGGNMITRFGRWWGRSARRAPYGLASCVLGFLLVLPSSCNVLAIASTMTEAHTPGAASFAQTEPLALGIWMNLFLAVLSLVGLLLAVMGLWRRDRLKFYAVLGLVLSLLVIALFPASFLAMSGF